MEILWCSLCTSFVTTWPTFTDIIRRFMVHACHFNWFRDSISIYIFDTLHQLLVDTCTICNLDDIWPKVPSARRKTRMGSEMGQKLASLEILLQLLSNKGSKYIIVIILFQSYTSYFWTELIPLISDYYCTSYHFSFYKTIQFYFLY